MDEEQPKKKSPWGSFLSFALFLLIVAGRPIANFVNQLLAGANLAWANVLPILAGMLVLTTVVVAVGRALNGGSRGPQLPNRTPSRLPLPTPGSYDGPLSQAPGFEPIISPVVALVGVIGLVALGAIGLFMLVQLP